MEDNSNKTHLGNGAYAIFNGYNVELAANHHNNIVLTLEFDALDRLVKFVEQQKEMMKQRELLRKKNAENIKPS